MADFIGSLTTYRWKLDGEPLQDLEFSNLGSILKFNASGVWISKNHQILPSKDIVLEGLSKGNLTHCGHFGHRKPKKSSVTHKVAM